MTVNTYILIVYTDEIGSTSKDQAAYQKVKDCEKTVDWYKQEVVQRRLNQFGTIVRNLLPTASRIIKNVGDSLVIKMHPTTNSQKEIITCLHALLDAWNKLNKQLRIVVHLADLKEVATGTDLSKFKKNLAKQANINICILKTLWQSIQYIEEDIFGAAMNLAARLAAVPHKGLFVISEEVVKALGESRLKAEFLLSNRIPLVFLKDMEDVSYKSPRWVRQIITKQPAPTGNIEDHSFAFYLETKRLQAFRVVNIDFRRGEEDRSNDSQQVREKIESIIKNEEWASPFFVDIQFEVIGMWKGLSPSMERRFTKKYSFQPFGEQPFTEVREKKQFFPFYIVFTSVPDESADSETREAFRVDGQNWSFYPVSYSTHEYAVLFSDYQSLFEKDSLFGLWNFQVRSKYAKEAQEPLNLFSPEGIAIGEVTYGGIKHVPIMGGLLKGELDGYILFYLRQGQDIRHQEQKSVVDAVKEATCLYDPLAPSTPFIQKLIPVDIYFVKLRYCNERNIKILSVIGNKQKR